MEAFEFAADLANGSSPTRVMINPVLAPAQWAQMEFALVPLGDPRRTQRLVKPATRLAESPGGTLPQALPHWEELKAADRFLSRPENTREQILRPQGERTLAACSEPGEYLLIEDTTLLDYSPHRATTGLGVVGDGGRGLCLHSTLAMKVTAWDLAQKPAAAVVGLLGQQCWAQTPRPAGETRGSRLWRNTRSSKRWAEVLKAMPVPPAGNTGTFVADREADFYEPVQRCQQRGVDFVIRACQNRRLAAGVGRLWEQLPQATVLGTVALELRARPGAAARRARVQLSCPTAGFSGPWRPGGRQEDLAELQVLEVKEFAAPAEVEPLRWILLTSLAGSSVTPARRIVGRYTARWHIEEYHKALKSGAGHGRQPIETSLPVGAPDRRLITGRHPLAEHQTAGRRLSGSSVGGRTGRGGGVGNFSPALWGAKDRLDPKHFLVGGSSLGWIDWAQRRGFTRLAKHLARLATIALDDRRIRQLQPPPKQMWVKTSHEWLGHAAIKCKSPARDGRTVLSSRTGLWKIAGHASQP